MLWNTSFSLHLPLTLIGFPGLSLETLCVVAAHGSLSAVTCLPSYASWPGYLLGISWSPPGALEGTGLGTGAGGKFHLAGRMWYLQAMRANMREAHCRTGGVT